MLIPHDTGYELMNPCVTCFKYTYHRIPNSDCIMPKGGFKSITISDTVYDRFNDSYQQKKNDLALKGIRSLSGYVSHMLEERMLEDDALARHAPLIKKLSVDQDRVVLLDGIKNRIVEVTLKEDSLFCQLCEETDCLHVGYCLAQPEVYEALTAKGIKV